MDVLYAVIEHDEDDVNLAQANIKLVGVDGEDKDNTRDEDYDPAQNDDKDTEDKKEDDSNDDDALGNRWKGSVRETANPVRHRREDATGDSHGRTNDHRADPWGDLRQGVMVRARRQQWEAGDKRGRPFRERRQEARRKAPAWNE